MHAGQIMSRDVITCGPDDSLADAVRKMRDHGVGCLLVVDRDDRLVGVMTDRDVCFAAFTSERPLKHIPVKSAMTSHVYSLMSDNRIQDVEVIMSTYKVRRVPIVDGENRVLGVVSLSDIARAASRELRERHPDVTDADLVTTISQVCKARGLIPLPAAD
ncbi:MAG TPA: CBS domain-containing protein [Polyangiaceae bacterium]|nr:CBS domain-containing protein [Polyangiaceae bacterium]